MKTRYISPCVEMAFFAEVAGLCEGSFVDDQVESFINQEVEWEVVQ